MSPTTSRDFCGCHYDGIDMSDTCEHRDPDGGHRPWAERSITTRLRERYTEEPSPPCRVCGEPLSMSSSGGGNATKYNCSSKDAHDSIFARPWKSDNHYSRSEWTQLQRGDSLVLEACDQLDAQQAAVQALKRVVEMADSFASITDPTSEWSETMTVARAALVRDKVPA